MEWHRAIARPIPHSARKGAKWHSRYTASRGTRARALRRCRGVHMHMMRVVHLRRKVIVEDGRQHELAVKNAEQRLAQAKRQQRQERQDGALAPQPLAHQINAALELPPSIVDCSSDSHTTTCNRPP